ncbi:lanthionine synthetase LanC family protein [Roseivirga sp. BDSF3-8]|uniref:lanthionine synthetase LanC family protein n=1 Tax=Roseivirga sp. BDSF3-8 TaxID=3241598 RepID=UPI003531998F
MAEKTHPDYSLGKRIQNRNMTDPRIKSPWGVPSNAIDLMRLLLESARSHPEGLRWEFNMTGNKDETREGFNPNLADGSAGVVATLLNAYSATGDEQYLEYGKKGLDYLFHHIRETDSSSLGLYRGLGGTALLCAHLTRLTGQSSTAREALALLSPRVPAFLSSPHTTHTLVDGSAGALIAFLNLAAATGDPEAWKPIYQIAEDLIKEAQLGHDGLYWRPYYPEAGPLCGLAEGNAGIAWALAELARLSQQNAWFVPAEMALEYEIASMEEDRTPDRRTGIRTAEQQIEHLAHYHAGDKAFFEKPAFHSGWGYGDTGTLLAWQRIAKISPTEQYVPAFPERAPLTPGQQPDLISEELSRAIAYYRSAVLLGDARPLVHTRHYAEEAMQTADTGDLRLLGGLCGILHTVFAGSAPTHTFDYFFPVPAKAHLPNAPKKYSWKLRKELISHSFRRTLALMDHLEPDLIKNYLQQQPPASAEANFFHEFVDDYLTRDSHERLNPLREVFTLEKEIFDMGYPSDSYAFRNIAEIARKKEAESILNLSNADFSKEKLVMNPEVKVLATERDWSLQWHAEEKRPIELLELLQSEQEETYIMIRPNATRTSVLENSLSELSHFICLTYATPQSPEEALARFKETFKIRTEQQLMQATKMLLEKTREFFNMGILLKA